MKIASNIVPQEKSRQIQSKTLSILANSVAKSYGPFGSTTAIVKNLDKLGANINIEHTKDGYTIVKNIEFLNPIERSVKELITELTHHVVKEVGDGTTSAVLLCDQVFSRMSDLINDDKTPADLIKTFNNVVDAVKEDVISKSRECTLDDIYDIALISINNNEEVAATLQQVYKEFGLDVYIDVGVSNQVDNIVKKYDGMTLETGFTNPCFINNKQKNSAAIRNPKIYFFDDPIDTPEMLSLLDTILFNNILRAYQPMSEYDPEPTVILCKQISPDTSSYFETILKLMEAHPGQVPLLIVSDIHQEYLFEDIRQMCGAPTIRKYLNPDLQKEDIEKGLAPTPETIVSFCGSADLVEADSFKTKIINPSKMFNEDGSYSDEYNTMVSILENEVTKAKNENSDVSTIARLKKRLNCFKGNMVDFLVGGITLSDRTNLKGSVEDAVLNCRSAAANGVGYGANFMAYQSLMTIDWSDEYSEVCVDLLKNAYRNLLILLYSNSTEHPEQLVAESLEKGMPFNLRTNEFDGKVLSSIKSDVVVLDVIGKILTMMFMCNQYLLQTPVHNVYTAEDRD